MLHQSNLLWKIIPLRVYIFNNLPKFSHCLGSNLTITFISSLLTFSNTISNIHYYFFLSSFEYYFFNLFYYYYFSQNLKNFTNQKMAKTLLHFHQATKLKSLLPIFLPTKKIQISITQIHFIFFLNLYFCIKKKECRYHILSALNLHTRPGKFQEY